jgi:DNA-directed RNA polymerase subunit K
MIMWPKDEFTRFEVARLLGARALQISLGAPVLVKTDKTNPHALAKEELKSKMLPMTVKRQLPDKTWMAIDTKSAIDNWKAVQNNGF